MTEMVEEYKMYRDDIWKDLDFWFETPKTGSVPRYPLTNIIFNKKTEDVVVEIALAGFSRDEIEIELEGDTLVVTGIKEQVQDEDLEYIQNHISTKDFERKIRLHNTYSGGDISATYNDGLLVINIQKKEKPKTLINIG